MKVQFLRRLFLVVLAVLLIAAVGLALLLPTTAQAYKDNQSPTSKLVSEIFIDNETTGGTFDKTNLQTLLTKLGATGTNLDSMVTNLQTTVDASSSSVGTTPRIYTDTKQIASEEIIVEFGGIKWLASFLSLTNDGKKDVVLTLWQAEVSNTDENKANWSNVSGNFGTANQNTNDTYPANMYGTSKIRSVTLNNGGSYTTNGTNLQSYTQTNTSKWAKFNMSSYMDGETEKNSNIYKYIATPRLLDWQKEQVIPTGWNWTEQGKALNNQHWGTMGKNSYYDATKYPYYEEKTNYSAWADDLIWIPSCAEVGNEYQSKENPGIWLTSKTQRSASDIVWLRTGGSSDYYGSRGLTADGVVSWYAASESHLVRPALHLNLTSAAQAANTVDKPTATNTNVTYNGQEQSLPLGIDTSIVNQRVEITTTSQNGSAVATKDVGGKQVVTATDADTYTITVRLKDDYRWENESNLNDRDPITITYTINKRAVTLDVKIPEGTLSTLPYGTSFNLSSGSSSVRSYWAYASGSATFVNSDENKLTVNTPTANQSTGAFCTPGKYPLYVEIGESYKAEIAKNYDLSFNGDFDGSGDYSQYKGKAATITVEKAKLTITANDATVGYGEEAVPNGVTCQGFADGEDVKDLNDELQFDFGTYNKDTAQVGTTYTISVSGCTSDNYEIEYKTGTLTVSPKKISLQISSITRDYGSTAEVKFGINNSAVWVNDGDQDALLQQVEFVLKQKNSQTVVELTSTLEVGTYDITAKDGVYGNYDVKFTSGEFKVNPATIQAADGAYTLAGANYNYVQGTSTLIKHEIKVNESLFTLAGGMKATFTYSELKKGGSIAPSSDYTLSNGIFSVWNVGEYTVKVTITAPNHATIADQLVTFTISPTEIYVTLSSQQIMRQYSDVIGNVNSMVFDELTVSASGFGGNNDALKKTLTFMLNGQTSINTTLPVGDYALTLDVADNGFTLTGSTTFNNKVKITYATINVDDVNWELVYTYALDASSQPVKYQLAIDEARVRTVGSVPFEVKYTNLIGASGSSVDDKGIYSLTKAGNYSITVTITAENHETLVKTLYMTINKATAVVMPSYNTSAEIWTSGSLPAITATATVNGRTVQGSISWTTSLGSVKEDGYSDFGWQWIPADENVEIATGTARLYVRFAAVKGIAIEFDPGDRVFYDTDSINDLKNYLTVTVTFTDGNSRVLGMNEYTLTCRGESALIAGESVSITITYMSAGTPVTQSFSAKVVHNPNADPSNPGNPDNPNQPDDPNPPEEKESLWSKINTWVHNTPLPLAYAAITIGAELLLIIILAIAARKPEEV